MEISPVFVLNTVPLHAHDIADIHFLEIFVGFLADIVTRHIALNATLKVLYIAEGSFSHHTFLTSYAPPR